MNMSKKDDRRSRVLHWTIKVGAKVLEAVLIRLVLALFGL